MTSPDEDLPLPWFDVRIGCMAPDERALQEWLEAALPLLPLPGDVIAVIERTSSLSRGEGFGD